MFSFFEGYRTLTESQGDSAGFIVPYVVLGLAAVLEGTSWLRAVRQIRGEARAHERGIVQYIRSSDDPTVKTVASEDSAALVGILIAFAGILLHQVTGDAVYDGVASLLIGVVLVYVAFALGQDNMGLLMSSDQIEQLSTRIEQRLHEQFPQVDQLFLDPTAAAEPGARDRRAARETALPWSYPDDLTSDP